jgi:hypothetical protein
VKKALLHIVLLSLLAVLASCNRQKRLNKFVSLWRQDKNPYGCFYAFQHLTVLFPDAAISINKLSPRTFSYDAADSGSTIVSPKAYVIIGPSVVPDRNEVGSMIRFAAAGNQLFISSLLLGDSLLDALHLKVSDSLSRGSGDSLQLSLSEPQHTAPVSYIYPGLCLDAYFTAFDTAHTQVLGRNYRGEPDFIRMGYRNGGAIFIHLAPMAFSNFFLLHKRNKTYYDAALSYLPERTGEVWWDEYFRYQNRENFSALHFLLSSRAFRWAFWLTMLLFAILYIFESKRKQRALRIIPPPGNASVDFVKTIGRLYLQQKDNRNLALKMIAAFLEQVRSTYHIPTTALNDDFSKKLALRSGKEEGSVRRLVSSIHAARLGAALSDTALMDLYRQIEDFNKT